MDRTKGPKAASPDIPNKLYFRIGEVSDLVGVKPYVLRYWESEFPDIKPTKSKSGQRLYKRRDVEMLFRIKELLYEERFTINGARKRLKDFGRVDYKEPVTPIETADIEEEAGDEGPMQLDVFSVTDDVEPAGAQHAETRVSRSALREEKIASARDSSKTLIKIRRDLEDLLSMFRA